jgi:hypothetical protein
MGAWLRLRVMRIRAETRIRIRVGIRTELWSMVVNPWLLSSMVDLETERCSRLK